MNRDKPIANHRNDYTKMHLDKENIDSDPIKQFQQWLNDAMQTDMQEPNAMNLATVSDDHTVSSRTVLLKGLDDRGFVFFTNYESKKSRDLESTRQAALCFWWPKLERQVRVEGSISRVSAQESDDYYHSRPRGSQIGAHASPQSQVLTSYDELQQRVDALEQQFSDAEEIPRPEYWGGYRVTPKVIEFWQGRPSRLHDRIRFRLDSENRWIIERLAP